MRELLLLAAAMTVCAAPVLAEADRPDRDCSPQTTGSLPSEGHGVRGVDSLLTGVKVAPPEESWQDQARENAELRRREKAEGCPTE
jgi:hypothetical protein